MEASSNQEPSHGVGCTDTFYDGGILVMIRGSFLNERVSQSLGMVFVGAFRGFCLLGAFCHSWDFRTRA